MHQPIPEGEWIARLEGGPYDGHEEEVDELPDFVDVGHCPQCDEPHIYFPDESGKAVNVVAYKLIEQDDVIAKYVTAEMELGGPNNVVSEHRDLVTAMALPYTTCLELQDGE